MRSVLLVCMFISIQVFANLDEGIEAYHAGKYSIAFSIFKSETEKSNPAGKYLLASLYYQGHGVRKNLKKAQRNRAISLANEYKFKYRK